MSHDDDLAMVAISRRRVARVTGTPIARVDYWTRTGLVSPVVDTRVTPGRIVRHYGYVDVMALLVIKELRKRNVSLQHIRAIVSRLRAEGFTQPLTEVRYAAVGRHLFMQFADGRWVDARQPDQGVIPETLSLDPLRATLRSRLRRPDDAVGHAERRRGALGSKELVAGTRIPVATVQRYLDAGRSDDEIIGSFPALRREDIEAIRSSRAA